MKGSRQDSEAFVSGFDRDETCAEFECGGASSSKGLSSRQEAEALVSGFDKDETCAEFECGGASSSKDGLSKESNDQPLVFASKQQIDNRLERFDSHVNDSRILQQMGITRAELVLPDRPLKTISNNTMPLQCHNAT